MWNRINNNSAFFLPSLIFLFPFFLESQTCSSSQDGLCGAVKFCETIYFSTGGNSSQKINCSYEKSGRKIFETEYSYPRIHWTDSCAFYYSAAGDTIKT